MTSLTERETPSGGDMGPVVVDEKTTVSIPMVLTVGGFLLGAVLWANAMNVTLAGVQKDQTNDRERLQRIEQAIERVEAKVDRLKDDRR